MAEDTWTEIFREILFDIVMFGGLGALKDKFWGKAGAPTGEKPARPVTDEISKRILKKFDEPRGELFAFLVNELDQEKFDMLMRRQIARRQYQYKTYPNKKNRVRNEKYKPGDEDEFNALLTKLYVSLNGSGKANVDEKAMELLFRRKTFERLADMDDEQFDEALETLRNDPMIKERAKYYLAELKRYWPVVKEKYKIIDVEIAKILKDEVLPWMEKNELIINDENIRNKNWFIKLCYRLGK